MGKLDWITIVIIAANAIISFKGFNEYSFFEKYKFNVGRIRKGEQIRLFSSGFLHVNTTHLLLNMLTLYFFAGVVVSSLGTYNFIVVYISSLLFGNLLALYFNKENNAYNAVGASGAVTGVLYAAILLFPEMRLYMFFIPIPIPAYIFGIGYLLYSIYGMKVKTDNIGHDAHFGGAVGGYVITLLLKPSLFTEHFLMVLLLAIPILLLYVLRKTGRM